MFSYYKRRVQIPVSGETRLKGCLTIPVNATSIIILAGDSSYSRQSAEIAFMESFLQKEGFGTLVMDLSGGQENHLNGGSLSLDQLASRLTTVTEWILKRDLLGRYSYGYFGCNATAAAVLRAAAKLPHRIAAIVCRSGRLELASEAPGTLAVPLLQVAGSREPYEAAAQWFKRHLRPPKLAMANA